ncbi:helix-turn-helix domain-containing protein [Tunicatimonas pelagia]|uniref:helix-turn-helix domain-containing protein n=1 Tax=Tunicatimonas pelagia TaxID=931531 RepID=UPI0026664831|nr:helix-turn-helix domain-containing protein [Tunicatimonas pelagia]WKN44288.1 helix-turn-helix domain-containing protein [Tunicatimonas pelagia]
MPAHIVTTEDLMVFKEELLDELKKILAQTHPPVQPWLRSAEVRERLNISAATLQTFRINGVLPYSKIGGMLFYPQDGIQRVLEENLINNANPVSR